MFETKVLRDSSIELNNLRKMDDKYKFYYDESNNFRKIKINNGKLNIPINSNFVLGGVVHEENSLDYDVIKLITDLKLQKSIREIKLRHIANGSFLECLMSIKLEIFLKWILNSDLYIHMFILNFLYFSTVDIVDSAVVNSKVLNKLNFDFVNEMKSNLYTIAKIEESTFIGILEKYEYPNIVKSNIKSFIEELIGFISKYQDINELHVGLTSLRGFLKESIKHNELAFIENNETNILIEDFKIFYITPIYMFKNAMHEFDEEKTIFPLINQMKISYEGRVLTNYKQVKSEENKLIQISDVLVGIFAKFIDYITSSSIHEISMQVLSLNAIQKSNLDLIILLVNKSEKCNKAFLHFSLSNEDRRKLLDVGWL